VITLILGSPSDAKNGNVILDIWRFLGLDYVVAYASCHRHRGSKFDEFVLNLESPIIAMHGGMAYAAAGDVASLLRNLGRFGQIVVAIPGDIPARSAIEELPAGTALLTSGLNTISLKATLQNAALAIGQLAFMLSRNNEIRKKLEQFYIIFNVEKELNPCIALKDGLIPIEEKKS